jgi:hypothetical protein
MECGISGTDPVVVRVKLLIIGIEWVLLGN